MDVVRVREKYGRQFAMFGGIDKRALAVGEAAIDAELSAKGVRALLEDGGFFPGLDHSAPPDSPLPDPRATKGIPWEAQALTTMATCSVVRDDRVLPEDGRSSPARASASMRQGIRA
jgi:hypothetical protein